MKDNTTKEEIGEWDSNENAINGMTCEQASRFLGAFTAAFRALATCETSLKQAAIVQSILAQQGALLNSKVMDGDEQKFAEAQVPLGLLALGMAMICVNSPSDPSNVLTLAANGLKSVGELTKKSDIKLAHLEFHTRKQDGNLAIAVKAVPFEESDQKIAATAVGKAIAGLNPDPSIKPENN